MRIEWLFCWVLRLGRGRFDWTYRMTTRGIVVLFGRWWVLFVFWLDVGCDVRGMDRSSIEGEEEEDRDDCLLHTMDEWMDGSQDSHGSL
jgi:hypothetical protein